MGRSGTRVTKVGHATMHEFELPDNVDADDPQAVARAMVRTWPLWQRVLLGRSGRRAIARALALQPPVE